MKEIIINKDNLHDKDITEVVRRVKILLVNSNYEILLGYSHNDYQFIGGHVEDNESYIDTVNREIKEETGINLNINNIFPFAKMVGYYKNHPEQGTNRKVEIYYYEIKTDLKPDLASTKYTKNELDGNFKLEYIPLMDIEVILKENIEKYKDLRGIGKEMLELIKIYKGN